MATQVGLIVDRDELITRLKEAKAELMEKYEERHKKWAKDVEADRVARLADLEKRVKAMKAGKEDPGQVYRSPQSSYSHIHRDFRGGLQEPSINAVLEDSKQIDRAIRIFSMSTEQNIRLGPKMVSDLQLGRFL